MANVRLLSIGQHGYSVRLIDVRADPIMKEFIIQHLAALGRMVDADCFWAKPSSKSNLVAVTVAYIRATRHMCVAAWGMKRI